MSEFIYGTHNIETGVVTIEEELIEDDNIDEIDIFIEEVSQ